MINLKQTSISQSQNQLPSIPRAASRSFFSKCCRQPLLIHQTYLPLLLSGYQTSPALCPSMGCNIQYALKRIPYHLHFQGELGRHFLSLLFPLPQQPPQPSLLAAAPPPPYCSPANCSVSCTSIAGCSLIMKPGCLQGLLR